MDSYQKYLDNAPDAQDAQAVKDEMVKLEFRQERLEKSQSREGYWMDDIGSRYYLSVNGNTLTLKAQEYVTKDQISAEYIDSYLLDNSVLIEYELVLHGNQLSGKWSRGLANVGQSGVCQVPPDAAAVTGEMVESEGKMILNHDRSRFLVESTSFLGANPTCQFVKMEGRSTAKISIYGPHKKGMPGVEISGFSKWGEGLFSSIGWRGRIKIGKVTPGSAAYEAGLRNEDEIMVIDGVAVKELSAGQAWVRLSGEIGTPVTLEVWRKGSKNTSIIKLNRVEAPRQ
jgi:hypothetical protein